MTEPTLNVTSLNENEMHFEGKARFAQIYRLICMKKGTDPLNPDKGVDINSYYYSYNKEETLRQLEIDILDQTERYTPYKLRSVRCISKYMGNRYILSILIYLVNENNPIAIVSDGTQTDYDIIKNS